MDETGNTKEQQDSDRELDVKGWLIEIQLGDEDVVGGYAFLVGRGGGKRGGDGLVSPGIGREREDYLGWVVGWEGGRG
jgi:hypothetical protein